MAKSNVQPIDINVLGTMRLVSANVKTLVFVYGIPTYLPLDEKHPLGSTNLYGRTKFFIEEMLKDPYRSDDDWWMLTVNLGTGNGSSVMEVIRTFEAVSGRSVPYEIGEQRAGDVAIWYADPTKEVLGWKSARSLEQMCAHHWRWQLKNPDGYRGTQRYHERSKHLYRHG